MLGGPHGVEGHGDADVVGVGIAAGHGADGGLGDGPPEEQEAEQAIQKPHGRRGQQRQRGVRAERGPDVTAGHHGEQQRGVGDVEGRAGEGALDLGPEDPQPGGEIADGDDSGDNQDSGDNAAQNWPFEGSCGPVSGLVGVRTAGSGCEGRRPCGVGAVRPDRLADQAGPLGVEGPAVDVVLHADAVVAGVEPVLQVQLVCLVQGVAVQFDAQARARPEPRWRRPGSAAVPGSGPGRPARSSACPAP